MIKFPLGKDNIDKDKEDRSERRSPATPQFSALMFTYFNKSKWLHVLFKRHILKLPTKNNEKLTTHKGFPRLCKEEKSQTRLLEGI